MDTPLQLKEYFFPIVNVTADPHYDSENPVWPDVSLNVQLNKDEKTDLYQVAVEINAASTDEEKIAPYAIELLAVGAFTVHPEWDNIEKLLKVTGASILYSAAREFIITITSRGPWPAYHLPTASFLNMYEEALEQTEESHIDEEVKKEEKKKKPPKKKAAKKD